MSDSQKPRVWTGVKRIVYEWSEEGSSSSIFDSDNLSAVILKTDYDQLMQQALAMREALDLCGEQLKYLDDLFRTEGCDNSVVWNKSNKALEQFDEFMKDQK